jgi:hypothetical protein
MDMTTSTPTAPIHTDFPADAPPVGPLLTRDYVATSHQHFELIDQTGRVVAHRYQHIVTGTHYVRDYATNGTFGAPVYEGRDEIEVRKAWVRIYRKWN